ncbi:DapH/DapD/GlmU-related protein [Lachnospiraceae bacterium 42-17]|jgi:virginiamycin A acetyltransferase|nr:hypothetical protein [Oscillospiraceae bacterium]
MIKRIYNRISNVIKEQKKKKHWRSLKCTVDKKARVMNTVLEEYVNITHHAEIVNSVIGKRTSIGRYSKIRDSRIGSYCSISWDVTIGAVSHPLEYVSSHAFLYRKQFGIVEEDKIFEAKGTIIGNDVWIGCGSIIMDGITIGDGAVIGAGSVVTKDVLPYSIIAGVPAKLIRKRFDNEIITGLLDSQWWTWEDNELKSKKGLLDEPVTIEIVDKLNKKGRIV